MKNIFWFLLIHIFALCGTFEVSAESYNSGCITYLYNPNFGSEEPQASVSRISWVSNAPKHIIIPEKIEIDKVFYSVTSIEDNAADRLSAGIDSISIPNTVKVIGEYAFSKSNLRYIKIGSGVINIKNNAFKDCSYLKAVEIEDLEAWCKIVFGTRYSGGSTTSQMTYYENANPLRCGHKLYLKGQLVDELIIPESITSIQDCAFIGGFFRDIKFHHNLKGIGDSSFLNAEGLITLDLSESAVWGIGDYAFSQISTLETIKFSKNIGQIGLGAFANDDNVKDIWCPAVEPPHVSFTSTIEPFYYVEFNKYNSTYYTATLFIPQGSINSYKSAYIWGKFHNITEDESMSGILETSYDDKIKVFSKDQTLFINGTCYDIIRVFDTFGRQIYIGKDSEIHVPNNGIYLVSIGKSVYKILVS